MKKKEKILLTLLISITTILITAITYSFFVLTVDNKNAQYASITTGSVSLVFADGKETFEATELNLGESATKTFVVTNNNEIEEKFHLFFKDLVNTHVLGGLTYTLEYSNSKDGKYTKIVTNKDIPAGSEAMLGLIASDLRIPANTTLYYKLTITYNHLDDKEQTSDEHAVLNTKFTITNGNMEDSFSTLVALGLENRLRSEPTDYNMFNYTWAGYNRDGKIEGIKETQGIYSMEDDFGTSYYFRGPKTLNNIVKFGTYDTDMYYYTVERGKHLTGSLEDCQAESADSTYCTDTHKYASAGDDMYWRIVRINGDGTLRLLYIGTSASSLAGAGRFWGDEINSEDPKYFGYTYDNSAPDAGDGAASSSKIYLDEWYSKTMVDEDVNVALAQFYCDTSGYSYHPEHDRYYYSTSFRLNKYEDDWGSLAKGHGLTDEVSPTLKTSPTTQTYGGRYNLKVGLINVDELVLSGFDGVIGTNFSVVPRNLLSYATFYSDYDNGYGYRTMSPFGSLRGEGNYTFFIATGNGSIFRASGGYDVRPVINLTKEFARTLAWDAEGGYYVAL